MEFLGGVYPELQLRLGMSLQFRRASDSASTGAGVGEVQSEHIRNPVTGEPFEGFILLPGGINMKKSTVTNIRRWSLRDDAAGWNMAHENVAGFVTVQRYNEKGPVKAAG